MRQVAPAALFLPFLSWPGLNPATHGFGPPSARPTILVMAGLDPVIHAFDAAPWIPGSRCAHPGISLK
jgi:hypothetical protein